MAKQTFTVGQVLTASEMTSLQQTAMGGGSATAKVASYVLVAADAGTTVAMNAAGATTITVNTGLFAAGDTVFIQNLGAGACTVTAGTATVATAGSLILPQNDAGILYFTATGASIFYDFIQVGAVSPLTTKGDLYTFSTSDARLAVGATNGMALTVDSAEATGLKYVGFVGASAYRNASQTISNATETALTFNSENYDTDSFHDNSTNNTRMTVPAGKAGKYLITANTTFTNNATGQRIVYVYVGATLVHTSGPAIGGSASIDLGISTSYVANLAVADIVEVRAYQNSGGSLAILGNTDRSSFQVSYLGA